MKTQVLIAQLANDFRLPDVQALERRFRTALFVGLILAALGVVSIWGIRPDLAAVAPTPIFGAKLIFPGAMIASTLWIAARLAIPGASAKRAWKALIAVNVVLWIIVFAVVAAAAPGERVDLLLGHTWHSCSLRIAAVSIPSFIAFSWAMRGLAPTRPRQTGAAVGLLAGAIGTLAYTLKCPEMSVTFWAVWYSIGMGIPALIGIATARMAFRWA
ncbi:DUF1109 domain-containing protein [Pararobbsia alpina]|uniref:DUF1109 domain-containing protein n=1 Tax=Pararobbsia alpina TaxID=621374 RepID=UPI0039A629D6